MKKFSSTMRGSSRRSSPNKRIVILLAAGILAVSIFYVVPRAVSGFVAMVFSPVVAIEHWLLESTDTIPAYFRDRNTILAELDEAEKALSFQSGADITIDRLQRENELLRNLLGASSTPRIAAGVIGRPTALPYDVLVLDIGSTDGVVINAPVFSSRDQVIGYISAVYGGSSIVTLATTPGLESTVYIMGPNIYTTAVGQGGGVLRVGVPQGVPITIGDLVVIPSFDAGVYGSISTVESVESRPEQFGYVTIDVPLQSLRWVSVGTKSLQPSTFEEARAVVDRVTSAITTVPVPDGVLVEIPDPVATTSTSTAEIEN